MDREALAHSDLPKPLLAITNALDIKPLPPDAHAAAEQAYRRGFYQGAFAAFDALTEKRCTESEVENWIYDKLLAWRYADHDGEIELPPECKGGKK